MTDSWSSVPLKSVSPTPNSPPKSLPNKFVYPAEQNTTIKPSSSVRMSPIMKSPAIPPRPVSPTQRPVSPTQRPVSPVQRNSPGDPSHHDFFPKTERQPSRKSSMSQQSPNLFNASQYANQDAAAFFQSFTSQQQNYQADMEQDDNVEQPSILDLNQNVSIFSSSDNDASAFFKSFTGSQVGSTVATQG